MTGDGDERSGGATAEKVPTVKNIQALRGVAALLVIWAHLKFALATPAKSLPLFFRTDHGAIGVDVFFIISGYVICLTACKKHHHSRDFFLARIARVVPLYLTVTLLLLGKDLIHFRPVAVQSVWNGLFYLPIFDWGTYTQPLLIPGWTLSFEMWFYVTFALLLNIWKPSRVVLVLPLFFVVGSLLMSFYHPGWYFPRFIFHPFTLEFALGCLIFQTQGLVRGWAAWLLIAGGVAFFLAFMRQTGFLGLHEVLLSQRIDLAWFRVFAWGLPSALIVAGLVGLEINYGYVLPAFLVWLGEISYSLYLTHLFSIQAIAGIATKMGWHDHVSLAVVSVISSVALGWLCWKWIEKPLTKRAQRQARNFENSAARLS